MPISGYFDTPFANSGSLTPVPDATQTNGTVSYQQGWPIGYSTPVASGGFNIPRAQMNQLFNDITSAIQNWQQNTIAPFITSTMNGGMPYSYPQYALVMYGGVAYQSNTSSNTDTPPSSKWNIANIGALTATSFIGANSTGTNTVVIASLTPSAGFSLIDGYSIVFKAGGSNSGSATLSITSPSITATSINKNSGSGLVPLNGGEIVAGNEYVVIYQSTAGVFVLQNPTASFSIAAAYPVGSIYISTLSTNPGTSLGFGTWVAYGAGQVLIGVGTFTDGDSTSQTITAGQQLGEYQHTLTTTEMPSHSHSLSANISGAAGSNQYYWTNQSGTNVGNTGSTGGGAAHNNIQPSLGVYIWTRTA